MADEHKRVSPWERALEPGRYGRAGETAAIVVTPIADFSSAAIIARRDTRALDRAIRALFSDGLPGTGRWYAEGDAWIAWDGPSQWRVVATGLPDGELTQRVNDVAGDLASVSCQSHGWATLRLSGPRVRDLLAKGTSLDLAGETFGAGQCAVTTIGHMGVHLTCVESDPAKGPPAYVCQMFRSMAGSFAEWIKDSGGEYGVEVK